MQSNIQWIEIVHGPTTVRLRDRWHRDFTGITQEMIRRIVVGAVTRQGLTFAELFSEYVSETITLHIVEDLLHAQKEELATIIFDDFDVLGYSYL